MAQYVQGTVSVTLNSATVTGSETAWEENISAGDLFTIVGSGVTYQIASVASDTSLTLTANYAGASQTGLAYVIHRERTPALGLQILRKGDIETATILSAAFQRIDELVNFDTLIVDPQDGEFLKYNGTKWINSLITALGTITDGTWEADPIEPEFGGTGLTETPSNGELLIGDGSGYTLATLTAGDAISITNGAGTITIDNTGVLSITGTSNQVVASGSTGAITLSLPQSIHTAATPTFAQLTLSNPPSNSTDAATKAYVDATAAGLKVKEPARALRSTNITVANPGTSTIDGVSLSAGNRVLLIGQDTASQNGLWVFNGSSSALTRPIDFDSSGSTALAGNCVFVSEGTTYGNTLWVLTTDNPITIDSTSQAWSQFGGPGAYSAGTGLTLTGTSFSLTAPVSATLGGTGINNGSSTITLAGSLTKAGAHALTLTTTGTTSVTLPTTGTLVNSAVTTLSSLVSVGTIGTGTWQGTVIGTVYGGTGLSSYTTGDILYASATNTLAKLGIGAEGAVLTVGPSGTLSWNTVAGVATFANRTNTVGLSAINGVSASAARADSAPALDQSIEPTWTGEHTFEEDTKFNGAILPSSGTFAASGTTQGSGTTLTKDINIITSSTADVHEAVKLPVVTEVCVKFAINEGSDPIYVFPQSGSQIGSLGVNAAYELAEGGTVMFVATSATQWRPLNSTYV